MRLDFHAQELLGGHENLPVEHRQHVQAQVGVSAEETQGRHRRAILREEDTGCSIPRTAALRGRAAAARAHACRVERS